VELLEVLEYIDAGKNRPPSWCGSIPNSSWAWPLQLGGIVKAKELNSICMALNKQP